MIQPQRKRYQLAEIVFLLVVLSFGIIVGMSTNDNITGASVFNIELIKKVGTIPSIVFDEDTNFTLIISNFFEDIEGSRIFFDNSPVNNITFQYEYELPENEFTADENTLLLCQFENTTTCSEGPLGHRPALCCGPTPVQRR